jgi:hypothetical protein
LEAFEKANERHTPFFYRIKNFSLDDKGDCSEWPRAEIRAAGGMVQKGVPACIDYPY